MVLRPRDARRQMREDEVVPAIQRDEAVGGGEVDPRLPFAGGHFVASIDLSQRRHISSPIPFGSFIPRFRFAGKVRSGAATPRRRSSLARGRPHGAPRRGLAPLIHCAKWEASVARCLPNRWNPFCCPVGPTAHFSQTLGRKAVELGRNSECFVIDGTCVWA